MRLGHLLLVGSSLVAVFTVIACQRPAQIIEEEGDDDDTDGGKGKGKSKGDDDDDDTAKADTCLGKAKLAFDDTKCNTCMSDNAGCCAATIKCFKENAECKTLQGCMEACKANPGGGGGDGGGGGGDGGGGGGGIAGCQAKCKTDHGPGLPDWQAFNTCTQATCSADCSGGGGTAPPANLTPAQAFAAVYAKVNPACGSCHLAGTNGAKIIFGANEAATYTLFKGAGYEKANSPFYVKGTHLGRALLADEKAAIDAWVKAEAGGGAGTGGGGGDGGGGGGGGGGK